MRYPPDHKEQIRERIINAASRRFRRKGMSVGVAELMKASKLTHGGFYRYFESKNDLFTAALEQAFEENLIRLRSAMNLRRGRELEALIELYLSEEHCAQPEAGCPVAALAAELARQPFAMRVPMERGAGKLARLIAPFMRGSNVLERELRALVFFSGMAGTLALARAIPDVELRRDLLAEGRRMLVETYAP